MNKENINPEMLPEKGPQKCVLLIDESLPLGIIANTAGILGITLGRQLPQVVGDNVYDASGNVHLGIIKFPVPVLRSNEERLKALRQQLYSSEYAELTVVDFSDLAQGCKTYAEFGEKMQVAQQEQLRYFGLGICGPAKKINKLTGSLPLLR